jgi:ribonuclease VapC
MVVDASVILSIAFDEPHARWSADRLQDSAGGLYMSTVNLTEVLVRLQDRRPDRAEQFEERIFSSGMRFVPPDEQQARIAARARLRFPINLGDCFAYALATVKDLPILTTDADFRSVDREVIMPG